MQHVPSKKETTRNMTKSEFEIRADFIENSIKKFCDNLDHIDIDNPYYQVHIMFRMPTTPNLFYTRKIHLRVLHKDSIHEILEIILKENEVQIVAIKSYLVALDESISYNPQEIKKYRTLQALKEI